MLHINLRNLREVVERSLTLCAERQPSVSERPEIERLHGTDAYRAGPLRARNTQTSTESRCVAAVPAGRGAQKSDLTPRVWRPPSDVPGSWRATRDPSAARDRHTSVPGRGATARLRELAVAERPGHRCSEGSTTGRLHGGVRRSCPVHSRWFRKSSFPVGSPSIRIEVARRFKIWSLCRDFLRIGETGFEPAAARPPAGCATRLRHSPWCRASGRRESNPP